MGQFVRQEVLDTTTDGRRKLLTSADGVTWVQRPAGVPGWFSDILYAEGQFVAVGQMNGAGAGVIITSTDGINWVQHISDGTAYIWGIGYGNGGFVAVGDNGISVISDDGVNWVKPPQRPTQMLGTFTSVSYGNGQFVAVGPSFNPSGLDSTVIVTSADGRTGRRTSGPV